MTMPGDANVMASVYTDFQGLNSLKAAAHQQTTAAKKEAARQFEAVFIEMMLQSMRKATPKDSLLGDSQTRLYRGLYDHQIALDMAQGSGIGLRGMIEKALGVNSASGAPGSDSVSQAHSLPTGPRPTATALGKTTTTGQTDTASESAQWPPATPQAFVTQVMPYARAAAARIGVQPDVLVAQAALESGWGKRVPRLADGQSSYNLFGIKAGANWQGQTVNVPTLEYRDGVAHREQARFRAYSSIAASFADYAGLITHHPRYRQAIAAAGDPTAYLQQLQQAGYATDPQYAAKVDAILTGKHLAGEHLAGKALLAMNPAVKNPADGTIT
ncbi:flagellar assembly peptidoglycan hydrolase FlgJ [Acidihalobacter ferrooxydans]|uniref:Peptidoglycan hydrolase FlgJ n=1 Tax=Acidihalobacter ferrooxydans TaxID=1765967 RepID=A0A1P8UGT7_9GAMM|nr:flagellar assembly peptidoglycan hydrolase FlgJ [Acidihalobacter ferrooxydans]APZ42991.1 flagellar rod assembly protein/muramidase FlgJ [Acidihalobacter ferrooxydans]